MNNFAENMKIQRKKIQKTQTQLAIELHMTRQSVSNYESGKRVPDFDTLIHIADYLEISVDELIR